MARAPRRFLVAENTVNHCTWRSHNNTHVFATDEEREKFLALIAEHKVKHDVGIYSYCLMGTHPHVVTVAKKGQKALSKFWQAVNGGYARWYNARYGRRGQVVTDRFRSPQIQDERHLLCAMRYGDSNPVKAGLVGAAYEWRWSSHRHYALGEPNELVEDPAAFLNLGSNGPQRRLAYRRFAETTLPAAEAYEQLVNGLFIGDAKWVNERLATMGRRPRAPDPPGVRATGTSN